MVGIADGCLGLVENATIEQERAVMSVHDDLISSNTVHIFICSLAFPVEVYNT